jgi:hypothetical protein
MTMSKRSEWEPDTPESREYLARMRLIVGWDKALYHAYKHDTTELSAYLRRPDLPLDEYKREDLAALIDRRIGRKAGKGRKPGRIPPLHPDRYTEDRVVALARDKLDWMRQRIGGKLPPGSYRAVLHEIYEDLVDNFEEDVEIIDEDRALKKLWRGRR